MYYPKKAKNGFTLIELMVGITVIGILASIGMVMYVRVQANARDSRRSSAVSAITEALEKYNANNGEYPSCADMSQSINIVATNVLPGISPSTLTAPTAPAGTNSINCSTDDPTSDVYNYVGGKGFVLKYQSNYNSNTVVARSRYGYNLTSLSTFGYSACGISADSHAYCWGSGEFGKLGSALAGEAFSNTPLAVSTGGVMANKSIKSISSGGVSACAIDTNNAAYCWGDGQDGELGDNTGQNSASPRSVYMGGALAGKNIKAISNGRYFVCAIASDNKPYCWGDNTNGQLGDGTFDGYLEPVAVSTSGLLSGKTVSAISSGGYHACAIASDNIGYCWGKNGYGELGNNSTTDSNVPVRTNTGALAGKTLKYISVGRYHTCAIANNDLAYCWGDNGQGQLGDNSASGDGTYNKSNVPVAVNRTGVMNGKTFKAISAGDDTTCVISTDNMAFCWGNGWAGNLGDNLWTSSRIAVTVDMTGVLSGKTLTTISVNENVTCANTSDGKTACWGEGQEGQLGSDIRDSGVPALINQSGVLAGKSTSQVSTGTRASCAIGSDKKAYCWGDNGDGQLGTGKTADRTAPALIATGGLVDKTVKDISIGLDHACAIANDNNGYCWGSNVEGAAGRSEPEYRAHILSPITLGIGVTDPLYGKTLKQITMGEYHSCAIASDNKAYCWGANWDGQLGINNTDWQDRIQVAVYTGGVLNGLTMKSIDAGADGVCAIASNDRAYCWGVGQYGQNGNGASNYTEPAPVAVNTAGVLSGKTIKQISRGTEHTCVIASDNKAYCWGAGWDGQLGNGDWSDYDIPVEVDMSGVLSGKTIKSISADGYTTCVIASDDKIYCWGDNTDGELGDGTFSDSNVPTMVSNQNGKTFKTVSVGEHFACAITTNGEVYCWGDNTYGQFGNRETTDGIVVPGTNVPVSAFF